MSSSSSSKRLAVVVAAGHHATATASDPNNQQMSLKSSAHRSTHVNLILASFFLGSVLVVSCMCMCMNYCFKTRIRRRYSSAQGKVLQIPPDSPNLESSVYTLQGDCPYGMQYCDASVPPPYRRPPTPGPPPAYDSVVSKSSKYRKFGESDDYSDEEQRFIEKDQTESESMSRLNKLRQCKFQGNCSLYTEDELRDTELGISNASEENATELRNIKDDANNEISNAVKDDLIEVRITIDEPPSEVRETNQIENGNNKACCCHQKIEENVENDVNTTSQDRISILQLQVNCENVNEAHSSPSPGNSQADSTNTIQENQDPGVLPSYEDALVMASQNVKK